MPVRNPVSHAAELHQQAIVIDCHSDILKPIADGKMRLSDRVEVPDPATWVPPVGMSAETGAAHPFPFSAHTNYFQTMGQYDIPRFVEGGVTAQVCGVYIDDGNLDRSLQRGLDMVWCLHREAQESPNFELATTAEDIRRVKREGKVCGVLSFEGSEALGGDVRYLDLYHRLGLRMASLTHNRRNFLADGPQLNVKGGGLTAAGKQAIRRMNELGIIVDLVHINDVGFWEILELTSAPVVMSHTSPWMFQRPGLPGPDRPGFDLKRDKEILEGIAKNGGVLGVIFYRMVDLEDVVGSIEFLLDVIGPDHVGLGSDLYGMDRSPKGLEDMSKVPGITRRLVERGYSDESILKILGGNFMRVFEQVWKG